MKKKEEEEGERERERLLSNQHRGKFICDAFPFNLLVGK